MKNRYFLLTVLFLFLLIDLKGQTVVRNGLPNFFEKIKEGKHIRIAYFGGSITAQPGWRVQSLNYLREKYPVPVFEEHNATIGGTGSDLGVLRMDYDLLRTKPDLLFVEFAVNDSETDAEVIQKSMEGIVRKTWKQYPDCDICFVYTFHEPLLPELLSGQMNESVRVMEAVAEHYGIPTVHLGTEALDLLRQKKLIIKPANGIQTKVSGNDLDVSLEPRVEADGKIYFSPDGVHPYLNTGHVLYTRTLIKGLDMCEKLPGIRAKHKVGTPLSAHNSEYSISVYPEQIPFGKGWIEAAKGNPLFDTFALRFKSLWKGEAGSEISFQFKGSSLIAYDLIGPGGCQLEVTVDGVEKEINRFDGYCTYWRIASVILAEGLDPAKVHQVSVRVKALEGKKEILFERNRNDLFENPSKYSKNEWYVGNFFILGKGGKLIK